MNVNANVEQDEYDEYGFRKEKWHLYKPKKYYLHPENEYVLQQNLKKMEDKMKEYKYYEDIPRMYTKVGNEARGIDLYEENLWFWTIHGILVGYPLSKLIYGYHYTSAIGRRFVGTFTIGLNIIFGLRAWSMPQNQPQNLGVYEQIPFEMKIQNMLDYKYDIYRNVDKLKYTDKYMTKKEALMEQRKREAKQEELKKDLYKKYGLEYVK